MVAARNDRNTPAGAVLTPASDPAVSRLDRHVRELQRLLDEERQRVQRLTELNESKSHFLSLASHELRGPLTVLTGHLSLLESGAFGPVPESFVNLLPLLNIRLAEMESFINAMLEASQLEDHTLHLLRAPVDVQDIVAEALQRNELFLQPEQHISLLAPETAIVVNVDRARMVHAVGNLVHNAIKHSVRHTDVRVAITAMDTSVSVSVSDDGIGIAGPDLPILFTRFGRVRTDPTVGHISGTGLGLYLARELTRAHDGDITVVSEPGSGSTFTLTLPRPI
jgi:signal transduction histidine kinase